MGVVGAILCLMVDLNTLITLTGRAHWLDRRESIPDAPLAGATDPRAGRARLCHDAADLDGSDRHRWTIPVGLIYWAIVILPPGERPWNLREPLRGDGWHGRLAGR